MTRHALAQHAPRGAIFAVSSYGRGADDGRPPAELHPLGLEGPLGWLAEQLEDGDREQLEWLWDLAPDDLPRLAAVRRRLRAALSAVGPRGDVPRAARRRCDAKRRASGCVRLAAVAAVWSSRRWPATTPGGSTTPWPSSERDNPAPAVARRWAELLAWHPSLPLFWPGRRAGAGMKQAEWTVKAAEVQVANGTAAPDLPARLDRPQGPGARSSSRRSARSRTPRSRPGTTRAGTTVRAEAARPGRRARDAAGRRPGVPPRVPRHAPPRRGARPGRHAQGRRPPPGGRPASGRFVDDLVRAEGLPNADLRDLIDRARQFLAEHPESRLAGRGRAPARRLRQHARRARHRAGPRSTRGSTRPTSRPGSSATRTTSRPTRPAAGSSARRPRPRTGSSASGTPTPTARPTTTWSPTPTTWPRSPAGSATISATTPTAATPRDAQALPRLVGQGLRPRRVPRHPPPRRGRARRRQVPRRRRPRPGRRASRSPASIYGPSPVVRNTHRPIWDYTFPRPIRWKLGDPVTIRIIDYDWSDSVVYTSSTAARATRWPSATSRAPSSRPRGAGRPWSSPPTSRCPTLTRPE